MSLATTSGGAKDTRDRTTHTGVADLLFEEPERAGDNSGGVSREQCRAVLLQQEDTVPLEDADALFNIFDRIEDGSLTAKDF